MTYPSIVRHKKEELLELRASGLTIADIASKFGVNESSIRKVIGNTGRIRHGKSRPISIRFWEKVIVKSVSECWEWQGAFGKSGYGHIIWNGKYVDAHRVSYTLANESVPDGMIVLHKCNNKKCVNPSHLKAGTYHENNIDMHAAKRAARREGEPSVSFRKI